MKSTQNSNLMYGIVIMLLIFVAQVVAFFADVIFNDGRNVGVILMITLVCHLLNNGERK